MTIESSVLKNTYTGNASATVFAYGFRILSEEEILVTVNGVTQVLNGGGDDGYSVSGVGELSGGNITFNTAPASGAAVTLLQDPLFTQEIDYNELDAFPAESHEEGLDRATIRDLTLKEKSDRSLAYGADTATTSQIIEEPTDGYLLSFNGVTGSIQGVQPSSIELADFDTSLSGLAEGDLLTYNSTSSVWENSTRSEVLSDIGAQPLDAELTAIASLTSAANKVPYFTGSEAAGVLDFLDEDDMASDSATGLPSQQSVKAYSDQVLEWKAISSVTLSADATVDFTDLGSDYNEVRFRFKSVSPGTDGVKLRAQVSTDTGSSPTFQTTGYRWTAARFSIDGPDHGAGTKITLMGNASQGSAASEELTGTLSMDLGSSDVEAEYFMTNEYENTGGAGIGTVCYGYITVSDKIQAVRFEYSSGTLSSGAIIVEGR